MICTACAYRGISTGTPIKRRSYALTLCAEHDKKLRECAPMFERLVAPIEKLKEYEAARK